MVFVRRLLLRRSWRFGRQRRVAFTLDSAPKYDEVVMTRHYEDLGDGTHTMAMRLARLSLFSLLLISGSLSSKPDQTFFSINKTRVTIKSAHDVSTSPVSIEMRTGGSSACQEGRISPREAPPDRHATNAD
ncbi:hypothetical protein LZ32DRAFT_80174 [Colletotrichum eremochloae]|nr:hypothetical protein LZ32DRAFT_80174 [Colletotrichum eremochloae]